jgi:hypothetical protein
MIKRILSTAVLLVAALTPIESRADLIDVSDVALTAFAEFTTQLRPAKSDFEERSVEPNSPTFVNALVLANEVQAMPFPNIPTSQTEAFASSAATGFGLFGVGANGFFFQNSLPPNALLASGTDTQSITNNSEFTVLMDADFFIPAPTLQFFGVGNFFPPGVDPQRDVTANATIRLSTKLTQANGTTVEIVHLDYGLQIFREPTGLLLPRLTRDAGQVSRFVEPDGSFGFQLEDFDAEDFSLGEIGPGETLEITYDYIASASTGFGETGVFAAIGDPFNLDVSGGRFAFQLRDLPPTPGIPEPATVAMLGIGLLVMLRRSARSRRQRTPGEGQSAGFISESSVGISSETVG